MATRSAKTGKYVNKKAAKRRPATTVTESSTPYKAILRKLAGAVSTVGYKADGQGRVRIQIDMMLPRSDYQIMSSLVK